METLSVNELEGGIAVVHGKWIKETEKAIST